MRRANPKKSQKTMDRTAQQHRNALLLMLACTLMWSIGGVVTRQITQTPGFEVTFWRSVVAALTVAVYLIATQGGGGAVAKIRAGGTPLWLSGLCWAVMFSCFMIALSLTTVANVLITQSLGPIFTALLAWLVLRRAIPSRTWLAIFIAACGITLMYAFDVANLSGKHIVGVAVALGIPVFSAINLVLYQKSAMQGKGGVDFSAAVMLGGIGSALAMLPLALPFATSAQDLAWLTLLGVVQLGIPCVLLVHAARRLAAPEVALLALLEVIFGILLAWLLVGEQPGQTTLIGGAMVLGALALNEWWGMRVARSAVV
jgi:drug/metabolite transporter (DMT)-like permease